jgi:hypothetical protein
VTGVGGEYVNAAVGGGGNVTGPVALEPAEFDPAEFDAITSDRTV